MKILYLMHIPWGWIKQRPHFLALELNKRYNVDLYFRKALTVKSASLKEKKDHKLNIHGFHTIPFEKIPIVKHLPGIDYINKLLIRYKIKDIKSYDIIWICSVNLFAYFESFISDSQKIIYDCMDDELEFPSIIRHPDLHSIMQSAEKRLIQRANFILFSSSYLARKVISRTVERRNYAIINNAIKIPDQTKNIDIPAILSQHKKHFNNGLHTLLYVGAISEWFDFELIEKTLEINKKIQLVLIGPNDVVIPDHQRIIHLGVIERQYIFNFMKLADALVMPFKVNELIKAVNPVKLYEYILMYKPILAPRYGESEKFEEFVYLYDNASEFIQLSKEIAQQKLLAKSTLLQIKKFLSSNTWEARGRNIKTIIDSF